jgi:hypothetical protein
MKESPDSLRFVPIKNSSLTVLRPVNTTVNRVIIGVYYVEVILVAVPQVPNLQWRH